MENIVALENPGTKKPGLWASLEGDWTPCVAGVGYGCTGSSSAISTPGYRLWGWI